ncbi:hypothetical protein [Runella limosa]|uniref:hypothetical protein n=1 Tax=Runella limosa TaxID=370978 RepID=UPI00042371FB|nr:hypothetical protein [Runella limosa]
MKFYKLSSEIRPGQKIYPSAYLSPEMQGAEFIPDGGDTKNFFKQSIEKSTNYRSLIDDVPVFDYFVLKELYGERKKKFDWIKLNAYDFVVGHYTISSCFLVSEQFKETIAAFNLPRHRFYPAKLMYKGQKLDYYIFQLGEEIPILYEKCNYQIEGESMTITAQELQIHEKESFNFRWIALNKDRKRLNIKNFVFSKHYDYFICGELFKVISEPLKEALETAGLTEGWKFEDISPRTITFLNS